MLIIDFSNPRAPVLRGSFAAQISQGFGTPVASGTQVLLPSSDGLLILNVANSDSPTLVGQLRQFFYGTAARAGNRLAFIDDSHLYLVDLANTAAATIIGTYDLLGSASLLAIDGQRAYISDGSTRLWMVDISVPASPRELGFLDIAAYRAVPRAGYLYIASDVQGFVIADVRDPAHPRVVSRYQPGDEILGVVLNGDIAYVAAPDSLRIFNIHDPAHPRLLATQRDIMSDGSLLVADTTLYVTRFYSNPAWLQIFDISNPTRPRLVGQYPGISNLLAIDGSSLYATTDQKHLLRLDISNPSAPVLRMDYGLENFTQQAVIGRYVVTSAYGQGTRIFDIGTPSRVREVARDPNLSFERAIAANGLIYASSYSYGLYVLRQRLSIRGQVLDANGAPAAGVAMTAGGTSALTDATGTYTITSLLPGPITLAPSQAGFSFAPASQPITLSADLDGQNFARLPAPVALALGPGQAATLGYADTQGLRTELAIPSDALTRTATLTLAPALAQSGGGWASAGHAFVLGGAPGLATPLLATIAYSDLDTRVISDEGALALQWWNGARWQAPNCAGSISRDMAHNRLATPICAPGAYRLVGPSNQRFLPIVAP
jgi:hypothetical protein